MNSAINPVRSHRLCQALVSAICGAIALGTLHTGVSYVHGAYYLHNTISPWGATTYFGPAGLFWGLIFGLSLGLAHRRFTEGQREGARQILQQVGVGSSLVQFGYAALTLYRIHAAFSPWASIPTRDRLNFLLLHLRDDTLPNTCLQAALLMLLAGLLLPRNTEHTVQVTESLRL